jgi:DNA-binding MarR family transcriptional regulator
MTRAKRRASGTPRLEHLLAPRLWALAEAFEARLEAELAPLGISAAAFRLVGELMRAPRGLRAGELAKRLRVKPPSVTAMVAKLSAAGVVTTEADPDDARASVVRIATGAPLSTGADVFERMDRALFASDCAADRAQMAQTIDRLLARLAAPETK